MSKVNAHDKKELLPSSQHSHHDDDTTINNNKQHQHQHQHLGGSHSVGKDFHNILFLMFLYLLQGKSKS